MIFMNEEGIIFGGNTEAFDISHSLIILSIILAFYFWRFLII
jgi:hypothetical protein